jgi:hypothetical protein
VREEEGNAHQGVTAVVQFGIDDAAVAFAADHGLVFLHGVHHVDLAHGGSKVLAAGLLGHVAEGPGRREVRHRVAGLVLEHVVGHGHQRVLFAEHAAVFAHQGQAVHVGVHHDAQVVAALFNFVGDLREVFGQGLGVVHEQAGGFAVELGDLLDAQFFEQHGHGKAAAGVDRHLPPPKSYGPAMASLSTSGRATMASMWRCRYELS